VSAAGLPGISGRSKIGVSVGSAYNLPVRLAVESARKVVIVHASGGSDYKPTAMAIGNLSSQRYRIAHFRTGRDAEPAGRSAGAVAFPTMAKNDASVGEDYAPVGYYQDFEIRGFPLDLASGLRSTGFRRRDNHRAGKTRDAVEFLHGVDSDEVGVASRRGVGQTALSLPRGLPVKEASYEVPWRCEGWAFLL